MNDKEQFKKRGIHFREDQFDKLKKLAFDSDTSTQIFLSVVIDKFLKKINYKNYLNEKYKIEHESYNKRRVVWAWEVWKAAGLEGIYQEIQNAENEYQKYKKEFKRKALKDEISKTGG